VQYSTAQHSQPKGLKMKGSKLTSGVYWQGALKHKGVENKWGKKQGQHVIFLYISHLYTFFQIS
jgi:hypothetical protein